MPKKVTISKRREDFKGLTFSAYVILLLCLWALRCTTKRKEEGLVDLVFCNKGTQRCFCFENLGVTQKWKLNLTQKWTFCEFLDTTMHPKSDLFWENRVPKNMEQQYILNTILFALGIIKYLFKKIYFVIYSNNMLSVPSMCQPLSKTLGIEMQINCNECSQTL